MSRTGLVGTLDAVVRFYRSCLSVVFMFRHLADRTGRAIGTPGLALHPLQCNPRRKAVEPDLVSDLKRRLRHGQSDSHGPCDRVRQALTEMLRFNALQEPLKGISPGKHCMAACSSESF